MALIFADGFERYMNTTGDVASPLSRGYAVYSPAGGSVTLQNSFRGIGYSVRTNKVDLGKSGTWPAVITRDLGANYTELYVSFWMADQRNIGFGSNNNSGQIVTFYSSTNWPSFSLHTHDSGLIMGAATSGNNGVTASTGLFGYSPSAGYPTHIQLRVRVSSSIIARTIQSDPSGNVVADVTFTPTTQLQSHANIRHIRFGATRSNGAWSPPSGGNAPWAGNIYGGSIVEFDDVIVCDTTGSINNEFLQNPLDLTVRKVALTADGATNQFTRSSGATNYTLVNDVPFSDASKVSSSTIGHRDLYTLGSLASLAGSPRAIVTTARIRKTDSGTAANIKTTVRQGAVNYDSNNIAVPSTSFSDVQAIWVSNPDTGAGFTHSETNGSQVGVVVN